MHAVWHVAASSAVMTDEHHAAKCPEWNDATCQAWQQHVIIMRPDACTTLIGALSVHRHSIMMHPVICLQVLSYLDFFPTSVQRTAVATAANMCRMLSTEDTSTVEEAIPMLTNLLQYQVRHQHS